MDFLKTLFSRRGFLIALYILIGVFLNTAAPHVPATPDSVSSLHSWGQYIISVALLAAESLASDLHPGQVGPLTPSGSPLGVDNEWPRRRVVRERVAPIVQRAPRRAIEGDPTVMTTALNVNVFTAPEKAIIGERPRPWGPPMAWDATTSTLIFGENEAVLVDTLTTADEAEALARWIELHHRNLSHDLRHPYAHRPLRRTERAATPLPRRPRDRHPEVSRADAEDGGRAGGVPQVPARAADRDHGAGAVRQGRLHPRGPGAAHHRAGHDRR